MAEALSLLFTYIQTFFLFLISFIENILKLFLLIPQIMVTVNSVFAFMPPYLSAPFLVFCGICFIVALFHFWGNV